MNEGNSKCQTQTFYVDVRVDGSPLRVYMWTTYFYKLRFLDSHKLKGIMQTWVPLSICMWDPKWWRGPRCRVLVPRSYDPATDCEKCAAENHYTSNGTSRCRFLDAYIKQLDSIGFDTVLDEVTNECLRYLDRFGGNEALDSGELHVLFTGYEDPSRECSERFALARWLESQHKCRGCAKIAEWDGSEMS